MSNKTIENVFLKDEQELEDNGQCKVCGGIGYIICETGAVDGTLTQWEEKCDCRLNVEEDETDKYPND